MFTIEQIQSTHAKVKSGADFPAYVRDMIQLGVKSYDAFVSDGHTSYQGADGYNITGPAKYAEQNVADQANNDQFKHYLKIHQQGQTDYPTFCEHCAETGVEKWTVDMENYTCSYYDKAGNEMLVEEIPRV